MALVNIYDMGSVVRARAVLTSAGATVDPTTVTFRMKNAQGVTTVYVYGTDAQLVKDAIGTYHVDIPVPFLTASVGTWYYRFEGIGAYIVASEQQFSIRPSQFSG